VEDFTSWTRDVPGEAFDLLLPADLLTLTSRYGGARVELFADVIFQAQRAGAVSVLAEYRYIDADYRSEHSRFYSTTFRRYPSVAHRLHFFREPLDDPALDATKPNVLGEYGYVGYSVIRPVDASPVGRTMLPLHSDLKGRVACSAIDRVNVFGAELEVVGAPFMAQDAQLGVCVHVTAWVCAYYHHLKFGTPRHVPSDIAGYTPVERGRLVPSSAVTISQLISILERTGLPPVVYDLERLPSSESIWRIACRYLDSGFPVIAAGGGHSFVLVGYKRVLVNGKKTIQFIRQDDLGGPYEIVENYRLDKYKPWEYLIVPLPPKVYMSGERAEALGVEKMNQLLDDSTDSNLVTLRAGIAAHTLGFRTSAHRSNEFKRRMGNRCDEIASSYQWLQLPRWVWVVELVDTSLWDKNLPSVLGEVVIDATGHAEDARALAWRVPGTLSFNLPDYLRVGTREVPGIPPQVSIVETDTNLEM
jgi:hypothetical protein